MSSLADLPELVGFFSYSRDDDEGSGNKLSKLRERIQEELRAQLGRSKKDFRLWQDKAAISHGRLWEDEIKSAIDESVFFIPIVTPTAVRSHHCKFEFESFLAREAELGRNDLVFPIHYILVPSLQDEDRWRQDQVLKVVGSRQYIDWLNLRHLDTNSTEVGVNVDRFCANIVKALHETWISPEERRRQEDEARKRREDEDRRRSAEAEERRWQEGEARRRREEDHRRSVEAEERKKAAEERRRPEARHGAEGDEPAWQRGRPRAKSGPDLKRNDPPRPAIGSEPRTEVEPTVRETPPLSGSISAAFNRPFVVLSAVAFLALVVGWFVYAHQYPETPGIAYNGLGCDDPAVHQQIREFARTQHIRTDGLTIATERVVGGTCEATVGSTRLAYEVSATGSVRVASFWRL